MVIYCGGYIPRTTKGWFAFYNYAIIESCFVVEGKTGLVRMIGE
jgi:hypothetical protein